MKKAVNTLIVSCALCALAIVPASSTGFSTSVVEASPSLAFITGTVSDENGTPLPGAVVALLEPQPRGKEIKSVKTDTQGKFSADIVPGVYWLRATAEGFTAKIRRVDLDRAVKVSHDFALRRSGTLVQKRGDSDDYRWIARSVPRHVMHWQEELDKNGEIELEDAGQLDAEESAGQNSLLASRQSFHGIAQFVAVGSSARAGYPSANFFGSNFAVSGPIGSSIEMALIGQRGFGKFAPQRVSAIATMRPSGRHQVTASIGYGQMALASKMQPALDADIADGAPLPMRNAVPVNENAPVSASGQEGRSLDQLSVSAIGSWQVFRPLLVIYGFDYSRFVGSALRQEDSVLPRFAVQYSPSSRLLLNAAVTPGSDQNRQSVDTFDTENIHATFEDSPAEIAFNGSPILDRSRRFEVGIERLFGEGNSSLEVSAFYDLVSGHGVGLLALPLEASPETQATFQQVAHQVTAMNGAARGVRVMYKRHLNNHATASAGYSFGRGTRLNDAAIESLTPGRMFKGGFFQVATGKLDLDFTQETGTHISTIIRLSPTAVVFAIDPFAGRMGVYDPNINIYVTQELPNFGLPLHWQAIVDVRNLLDQANGVDDGAIQLIAVRARRTVRGGVAFRW